ncbi:coiled-coil domain-containing protein [Lutibacter citreus]|uniref:hypothetical protein n=1 Tax=Lutibacter citreus TaxID=2138210 RepID=UPI000DBE8C6D|nr:hypothetical protein [Lutibacter citreus]
MKNLKKLSVVLFATLLSLNFTSCIDDGVSDAVDQVYLAQAEFLKAQATLKEADAQVQLAIASKEEAKAQYQLALAEVQLANAREKDADTESQTIQNTYDAAKDAQDLQKFAAQLDVELEKQLGLLEEAKSANQVALVAYADAVAEAKDALLTNLAGKYTSRIGDLDQLYVDEISKMNDIAKAELVLTGTYGDETAAFVRAGLVADLAELNQGLLDAQAEIARLEGLTPSDAQQQTTDLEQQIEDLKDLQMALGVDLATKENAFTEAKVAFEAANQDFSDINTKQNEVDGINALITAHNNADKAADKAIATANDNIAAIPAAETAVADAEAYIVTAEAGVQTAKDDVAAAEAAVGVNYTNDSPDAVKDPKITDSPITEVTAWDKVWNAELAAIQAKAEYDSIAKYTVVSTTFGAPAIMLNDLQSALKGAILAATGTLPASIQAAQDTFDDAAAREEAAQLAFNADPSGSTWTDGTDGGTTFPNTLIGDHTDGAIATSYVKVATWQELPTTGSGFWYPLTYVAGSVPAIPVVAGYSEFDASAGVNTADKDEALADTKAFYVEIEADDTPTDNLTELIDAAAAAQIAENALNTLQGTNSLEAKTIADAQAELDFAYAALGYAVPPTSFTSSDLNALAAKKTAAQNDAQAAQAAIGTDMTNVVVGTAITSPYSNAEKATAYYNVVVAEAAVQTANAALGNDFRPGNPESWETEFSVWYDLTPDAMADDAYDVNNQAVVGTGNQYQALEEEVNAAGDKERLYLLPHVAKGSYTPSAYQELRNAYFMLVWEMEKLEALQTVEYVSPYNEIGNNNSDSNAKTITEATKDIAKIADLLVADEALKAIYDAQLADLKAAAGYDTSSLLWDHETQTFSVVENSGDYGQTNGSNANYNDSGYLPLLADLLNAEIARDMVAVQVQANKAEQDKITNIINHVQFYLLDNDPSDAAYAIKNVESFEEWVKDAIAMENYDIDGEAVTIDGTSYSAKDGLIKDIEQAEVLIAKDMVTEEDAAAKLEDDKRQLVEIQTEIEYTEDSAASILARMELLMN